jgi:hypothetical protein
MSSREQDATAQAFGQPRQGFERGLDGHVGRAFRILVR